MKVVLRMPDGARAVGSQVRVTMQPGHLRMISVFNMLMPAGYDYVVTSDQSGVAEFIDPGISYSGRTGELTVKHKTVFGSYYYSGIVKVGTLGRFEQDQSVILSPQKPESKDQNPYLQFTRHASVIVLGILGLGIIWKLPRLTTKRYRT